MASADASARNILLLIADDLGADSSSLTNTAGPTVRLPSTPNIDSLATNGVVFTNAYARPSCSITRGTLLTGRHPFRTGVGVAVGGTLPELRDDEYTLPRAFAAQAPEFSLASFGKWHLGYAANTPFTKGGWPYFAGYFSPQVANYSNWTKYVNGASSTSTVYATTDQVNEASAFITAQTQANKPWFAWVAFAAPHTPYHKPPANLLSPRFASLTGTTADINTHQRDYFEALTEALDKEIGRLLRVVDRANTDIIFVGDNGTDNSVQQPPYKSTPENHAKFTIFEGGVRVPLVITGPSVKYTGRNSTLVNTVDLFQTIQELAGINVAATLPPGVVIDSKSLLPALKANVNIPSDVLIEQFNQSTAADGQALRDGQYKLLRFDSKVERLYKVDTDPYETINLLATTLSADAQAHYNSLRQKFQNYLALPNSSRTRDPFPFPVHTDFTVGATGTTINYTYTQLRTDAVYTLYRTTDLGDSLAWKPLQSKTVSGIAAPTPLTTGTDTFTDPAGGAASQYFYQVVPSRW